MATLPNLLKVLQNHSTLSGLSVKVFKSMAMPINFPQNTNIILSDNLFHLSGIQDSMSYLGIRLTPSFQSLDEKNYLHLYTKIRAMLRVWNTYTISFIGKTTAIKMNVLSKLLYLFQPFPSTSPGHRLIPSNRFIWLHLKFCRDPTIKAV